MRAPPSARLQLAQAFARAGADVPAAAFAADVSLLSALAAEVLELGGSSNALTEAANSHFGPLAGLMRSVGTATGMPLPTLPVLAVPRSDWPGTPAEEFAAVRKLDDPFATLGQSLRAQSIVAVEHELNLTDDDVRRDSGGYYTPFKLAKRLAQAALDHPEYEEAVPAIIDPACGGGTFLAAAFDVLRARLAKRLAANPDHAIEPVAWTVAALHGVEVDPVALWAARLSIAVRAVRADSAATGAGQLRLFRQAATYGPLIVDRIRLGDSLTLGPASTVSGTERLRLRLLARDEPGRLPAASAPVPIQWDVDFPLRFADDEGTFKLGGFDLVLTNPPFVPVDRIPAERRRELQDSLHTLQRRFDLFIGFVERASTLIGPGGRASLLIPRTFLSEANAEKCRRLLLESVCVESIEELGPVKFDGAKMECVMLTFVARRPTETTAVAIHLAGKKRPAALLQSAFRRTPRAMFRLELTDPSAEECLKVSANSVPLGRYFCASWGARGSPVKDFHLDAPDGPLSKPMIKGDDVEPFRVRAASRWLLYDLERLYRPSLPAMFEHEKLVVRKVSGARGIVCAVDTAHHYTDDSLACVVRKADLLAVPLATRRRHRISIAPSQIEPSRSYDFDFIAALLQTPLVQTYYRVQLGGGLNVFPELIESLPLPSVEVMISAYAEELSDIGKAARKGEPFDSVRADEIARMLFGLD